MEQKYLNSMKELKLADLPDNQEKRLRELERQFNNEFGEDFYFMVMKRSSEANDSQDRLP